MGRQTAIAATEEVERSLLAFIRSFAQIRILVRTAATARELCIHRPHGSPKPVIPAIRELSCGGGCRLAILQAVLPGSRTSGTMCWATAALASVFYNDQGFDAAMVNAIVCQSTMKTFSSQTLISLLTAVGIAQASLRNPIVGVSLIVFILPITLMIIGLTSPKNGTQLDPSGRWYFYVVAKSWAFSLIVLLSFGLFCLALPNYMRDRVVRAVNGDTRRHQLLISFQGERSVRDSLAKKKLTLYDRHGLVGEIRDIGCTELFKMADRLIRASGLG